MKGTPHRVQAQGRARTAEMIIFLAVSGVGIYALGTGLAGLVEPSRGFDLLWLAVAAGAAWVLFAQMGRVRDTWPRRGEAEEKDTP